MLKLLSATAALAAALSLATGPAPAAQEKHPPSGQGKHASSAAGQADPSFEHVHALAVTADGRTLYLGTHIAILGPALAVLALLAYGFTTEPKYIPTPFIAKPAPPFTLTLFDGRTLTLEELRGKVVFLNFWASWCPPCRAEARLLEAAWQKYREQEVVFVGVNIQDEEENARAFLQEFGITYPNGLDRGARIAIEYGVWGLPETFFIDGDGRITHKHVGALGWQTITAKLEEATQGVVSASEGRGEYQSSR